jgi:hypothetical protein
VTDGPFDSLSPLLSSVEMVTDTELPKLVELNPLNVMLLLPLDPRRLDRDAVEGARLRSGPGTRALHGLAVPCVDDLMHPAARPDPRTYGSRPRLPGLTPASVVDEFPHIVMAASYNSDLLGLHGQRGGVRRYHAEREFRLQLAGDSHA